MTYIEGTGNGGANVARTDAPPIVEDVTDVGLRGKRGGGSNATRELCTRGSGKDNSGQEASEAHCRVGIRR